MKPLRRNRKRLKKKKYSMMIARMKMPCLAEQNMIKCDRHKMGLARNGSQMAMIWVVYATTMTQMKRKASMRTKMMTTRT